MNTEWNFKLEDAYDEIDRRVKELQAKDIAFLFHDGDEEWPKLMSSKSECRCPLHGSAHGVLFYACYRRISDAKRGINPRSARQLSAILEGAL